MGKRELPWVGSDSTKKIDIPGFGRMIAQSVGNTSHTTGLDFYLHREGEEESERGYVRYAVKIDDAFNVVWSMFKAHRFGGEPWGEDAFPHMLEGAQTLHLRDDTGYLFHVMGAIEMEQEVHHQKIRTLERGIDHLTKLLTDPNEPRTMFVVGAEPREYAHSTGAFLPATPEHKVGYRASWTRNLERSQAALEGYHAVYDARIAGLQIVYKAIMEWCHRKRPKTLAAAVIDEALAQARALAA